MSTSDVNAVSSGSSLNQFSLNDRPALLSFSDKLNTGCFHTRKLHLHLSIPDLSQDDLDTLLESVHIHTIEGCLQKLTICGGLVEVINSIWIRRLECGECHELSVVYLPSAIEAKFSNCSKLTSAQLPEVKEINFNWCRQLEYLEAPKAVSEATCGGILWMNKLKVLIIPSYPGRVNIGSKHALEKLVATSAHGIYDVANLNPNLKIVGPRKFGVPKQSDVMLAVMYIGAAILVPLLIYQSDTIDSIVFKGISITCLEVGCGIVLYFLIQCRIIPAVKRVFPIGHPFIVKR